MLTILEMYELLKSYREQVAHLELKIEVLNDLIALASEKDVPVCSETNENATLDEPITVTCETEETDESY